MERLLWGEIMLIIAVCDDNPAEGRQLTVAIETYLQTRGRGGKIFNYDSAERLNSVLESNKLQFNIIFLDIVMNGMDGMSCARWIRQQNKVVKLVFLTGSTDYVYEGYEVNAAAYLVKPINVAKLAAALDKTIAQVDGESMKESVVITSGGVTQRIPTEDILYLESKKNKVEIILARTGEKAAVYSTLDEFALLNPSQMWIRSHKSYIVNFLYIEQYAGDKFVLRTDVVIPISRFYKDKARDCFFSLLHSG